MLVIIDYDAGNIGSLRNMLKKLGQDSHLTSDIEDINKATKLILPGVGSFDYGMHRLHELGIIETLDKKKEEGTLILGICLGAQLMCNSSEEGEREGLKWVNAKVIKFPKQVNTKKLLVPHMGWDKVKASKQSRLFDELTPESRFYFVHSYYIQCAVGEDILAQNKNGVIFDSAFEKDNIVGVQFHPEKSHKFGKQLLGNFIEKY